MFINWSDFEKNGFAIAEVEDESAYLFLKDLVKVNLVQGSGEDLSKIHLTDPSLYESSTLNKRRISCINTLNSNPLSRDKYYSLCKGSLKDLLGPDLCMQKKLNMSMQLPKDVSSLLAIHADTWSGDSPFEVVVWLPFSSVFASASMYIIPAYNYDEFLRRLFNREGLSSSDIFILVEDLVEFIKCPEGSYLLFNQCLPHGNIENSESITRVSLNCRFKSLFSPFGTKSLGEFFTVINKSPLTQFALDYTLPVIN